MKYELGACAVFIVLDLFSITPLQIDGRYFYLFDKQEVIGQMSVEYCHKLSSAVGSHYKDTKGRSDFASKLLVKYIVEYIWEWKNEREDRERKHIMGYIVL